MADQPRDTGSRDYLWWFQRQTPERRQKLEAAGKSPNTRPGYDLDYPMQGTYEDDEDQAPSNLGNNRSKQAAGSAPTAPALPAPTSSVKQKSSQSKHSQRQRLPPTAATVGHVPFLTIPSQAPLVPTTSQAPLVPTTSQAPLLPITSQAPLVPTTSQAPLLPITSQAPLVPTTSQTGSPPYPSAPTSLSFALVPPIYEEVVPEIRLLVCWAHCHSNLWEILIGLYFQNSGRHPRDVAGHDTRGHQLLRGRWEVNLRKLDVLSKDLTLADVWHTPEGADGELLECIAAWVSNGRQSLFEEGIRRWMEDCPQLASRPDDTWLDRILWRSCWTRDPSLSPDWLVMANIKKMAAGSDKDEMVVRAESESPLFFARCMADASCGLPIPTVAKRKLFSEDTANTKRRKVEQALKKNPNAGMQVHGVPLEERAFDSKGNRLPWAYEYLDESRNSRRPPEEKGPFGRSIRRRGSTRSRAATPAKKEDPNVEAFFAAQRYDEARKEAAQQAYGSSSTGSQSGPLAPIDGNVAPSSLSTSIAKEPTEVILYGYHPGHQWAAIAHYEKVSFGMICEDYERQPPQERMRYPSNLSNSSFVHPRPLTRAERRKASQCHVGNCWIKVTFDSAEAADRACYYSPHVIQGAWVYAEPYRTVAPERDAPILVRDEDRDQGLLGAPKPILRSFQTLGSSSFVPTLHNTTGAPRESATLPRFPTSSAISQVSPQVEGAVGTPSASSSTASSATATGSENPNLRQRSSSQAVTSSSTTSMQREGSAHHSGSRVLTAIPSATPAHLRPASEAFLPQPSWSERLIGRLPLGTWIQGDIIGHAVPRLDNGEFDWARASFYWKFWYWLDTHFGLDFCGLQDE